MSNQYTTLEKANENITNICNPKISQLEKYWKVQEEISNILGEL